MKLLITRLSILGVVCAVGGGCTYNTADERQLSALAAQQTALENRQATLEGRLNAQGDQINAQGVQIQQIYRSRYPK